MPPRRKRNTCNTTWQNVPAMCRISEHASHFGTYSLPVCRISELLRRLAELIRNSIIESGSNSSGYYRKYADGTLEMWGSISLPSVTINTQAVNIYFSEGKKFALPVASLTTITGLSLEFYSKSVVWPIASTFGDGKSMVGYWLCTGLQTNVSGTLHYHCFGTWK